jgi:hypothetical protein
MEISLEFSFRDHEPGIVQSTSTCGAKLFTNSSRLFTGFHQYIRGPDVSPVAFRILQIRGNLHVSRPSARYFSFQDSTRGTFARALMMMFSDARRTSLADFVIDVSDRKTKDAEICAGARLPNPLGPETEIRCWVQREMPGTCRTFSPHGSARIAGCETASHMYGRGARDLTARCGMAIL